MTLGKSASEFAETVKEESFLGKPEKESFNQEKANADMTRLLEAIKPPDPEKSYLDLETAKAVMEKVTQNKVLLSTTNINKQERWELIKLRLAYHYSGNPALLLVADYHMQLNRSLTFEPVNVLAGLFSLPRNVPEGDNPGRWGRLKQLVGGR